MNTAATIPTVIFATHGAESPQGLSIHFTLSYSRITGMVTVRRYEGRDLVETVDVTLRTVVRSIIVSANGPAICTGRWTMRITDTTLATIQAWAR